MSYAGSLTHGVRRHAIVIQRAYYHFLYYSTWTTVQASTLNGTISKEKQTHTRMEIYPHMMDRKACQSCRGLAFLTSLSEFILA